jgi:sugar phosphate isomerase/epimerase
MKINQVAAQLYTCRDLLKTPADMAKTLKRIRAVGYTAVQVSGMGPISEEELVKMLDGEGLTCCATHEGSDNIRKEPEAVRDRLAKLNCKLTAYPYPGGIKMDNLAELNSLCQDLNRAGEILNKAGQILTYHNHGMEFFKTNGVTALDYIYQNTNPLFVQGEPDTYWIHYGGGENVAWCQKLKNRLPMIHLKDYRFTIENKPTFCEIGLGTLNFKAIIAAAEDSGCQWFIVEQDVTPGDPVDSLALSFNYIKENLIS